MLSYKDVIVYINATAKICDVWPNMEEINNRNFVNFNVIPTNHLGQNLGTIPTENRKNKYPILLLIQHSLVPKVEIEGEKQFSTEVYVELHDSGFVVFQLKMKIDQSISIKKVNTLINGFVNNKNIHLGDMTYNYVEYAEYILGVIQSEVLCRTDLPLIFSETFSVINPSGFIPIVKADSVIGNENEIELYEAAIRRMPDMSEAVIEIARNEQRNLSSYKNDLIYLNYHNLLVYVTPNKKHMNPSVYIELVNQFKLYIANLSYMQDVINNHLNKFQDVPNTLKKLRDESDWLDSTRFKCLKAQEEFESSIYIAALRVAWFNTAAISKFGIIDRQNRLFGSLNEIDHIISRKLELLQERQLQKLSAMLTIISILIAVLGIIVTR